MKFLLVNPAGVTVQRYDVSSAESLSPMPEGFTYVPVAEEEDLEAVEAVDVDGELTVAPRYIAPGEILERAQDALWEQVKEERTRRINGGVPIEIAPDTTIVLDSDKEAQDNIRSGVMAAGIPSISAIEFPKTWTLGDNSFLEITAEMMIFVGGKVFGYIGACHDRARDLRVLIYAAETVEELGTIPITEGWP